jgi:tight adherence protein B
MGIEVLIVGGVFVVILIFAFAFGGDEDEEVKGRISQFASFDSDSGDEAAIAEELGKTKGKKDKKSDFLHQVGQIITPAALAVKFEESLERADIPFRANEFAAIVFLSGVAFFCVGGVLMKELIIGIFLGCVGLTLPFIWLKMAGAKRLKLFNGQILDTLILLSNAVKAGYSMLQAMEMVARESPAPMGKEFGRVIREISLGVTIEESLTNLKNRVPSESLDLMVTVVLIQRQIGGNLSEILDKIAHTIRERTKILGDIQTLTAQGRISGMVIGGLPFALAGILYLINPEYMALLWNYSHPNGFKSYYLILFGIMMEAVGLAIIMHITDIEV